VFEGCPNARAVCHNPESQQYNAKGSRKPSNSTTKNQVDEEETNGQLMT
jgi:pyruvate-formate lyase-activating enzyme